jgi:O-acetyl-ADP-ribose deacetylase (regulator of RNase III)
MMEITLASTDATLCTAWERLFADAPEVRIHRGSILEVACDALVSPANSFGFMDGGIDAVYADHLGWDIQLQLRRLSWIGTVASFSLEARKLSKPITRYTHS